MEEGDFFALGIVVEGKGNGVFDCCFKGGGDGDRLIEGAGGGAIDYFFFDADTIEVAGGECTCFVKDHGAAVGEGIEGEPSFKEYPFAGTGANCRKVGGGDGDDEGAGGGGDEECKTAIDRPFNACIGDAKDEGKEDDKAEGEDNDCGGVDLSKAVEELLHFGSLGPRLDDEADDACYGGVFARLSHLDAQGAID
ncbi:MAG: hypothetical protein S4CHLAM102_11690 [Chlamydiia bacterium]|nr:hypothetical protein [Chlamydiia bacterium]